MTNRSILDKFFKLGIGSVAWAALFWMLFQVGHYLNGIVILFGLVILFTYILLAPVNTMEFTIHKVLSILARLLKLRFLENQLPALLPRALAILFVYFLSAFVMLVVSVRFAPVAFDQLSQFSNQLPQYIHQGEEWILNQSFTQNYFHQEIATLKSKGRLSKPQEKRIAVETQDAAIQDIPLSPTEKEIIREQLFGTSQHVNDFVREHIGGTFQNLITVISTTLAGFVYALTGLVLVFYFLLDGKDLKNGFIDMLPQDHQADADYLLSNLHSVMFGFVKGQVMLGMATGLYMIIVYSMFDVPYALFLGAFFALAEIIPVVGTWLGFLPGILVLLFINPMTLLVVMGLVYVFQLIKDNLVAPRVLGQVMGLHPVIVILSLLICAKIAGLVGVLFAIPLASAINVLIRFLQEKEVKKFNV